MQTQNKFSIKKMIVPGIVLLVFSTLGIVMWRSTGYIQPLILFGYIGLSLGVGLGLYAGLPKARKPMGRRLTLFLIGTFLIVFVAILGRENIQLEGVFFGLLTGVIQAGVIHYLIAKIVGPLVFGRLWCGWACWTVMILDLLPFSRPSGRLPGRWGWLRYLHFVLSLGAVALFYFAFGYRDGAAGEAAVIWFISGNLVYYAVGIILAFALKDNRAFCKYVCPVSVPFKLMSRFALLKVSGRAERCTGCEACVKMCPMDIRVSEYIRSRQRVLSTECSLCQTCVTACPQDNLKLSFGFDLGGKELLRERECVSVGSPLTEDCVRAAAERVVVQIGLE